VVRLQRHAPVLLHLRVGGSETVFEGQQVDLYHSAHEAQVDGYKMQMVNKTSGIPRVITIFSAPNYCDVYKNKAACLKFDNNVLNIKQFVDVAHPYYLPNFMDVFQWSLPFVAEKVTDMLANVLEYEDGGSGDEHEEEHKPHILEQKGGKLKQKVLAVSKLLRMYKLLRQEHDAIVQLKQLAGTAKLKVGLLSQGSAGIKQEIASFEDARSADRVHERRPSQDGKDEPLDEELVSRLSRSASLRVMSRRKSVSEEEAAPEPEEEVAEPLAIVVADDSKH